ncbi:MAG: hypothetical protein Q7Q73_17670 [Verrucomicrobiota bacterium JB024]|nr:hypothetical protein [Verrucomicrobiota bacterium JB024]
MSLINDALKKAQRDRETAGKEESASAPAHTPVAHAGPRPGNPAASRSFRWMRTIIAGTLVLSGIAAALLFMRTLIHPEPAPETEPPREVAVHIKLGHPDASTLPGSPPEAAPTPVSSATSALNAPTGGASPSSSGDISTPPAAPTPAEEPAIAFKLADDTVPEASAPPSQSATPTSPTPAAAQTAPVADAQPSAAQTRPAATANSSSPASPTAPTADSSAVATAPPSPSSGATSAPTSPATATTAASPGQSSGEPTSVPATGSAPAAQTEPEGPMAIAFALPKQPVTVAGGESAADATASAQAGADPAIIAFLEASRIAGVKVAGKQSRVLMNNQVFFIGSVVDPQSRLRIKAITNSEIEFVDESGLEYRKRFQR